MVTPIALIYNGLFPSISTFETLPATATDNGPEERKTYGYSGAARRVHLQGKSIHEAADSFNHEPMPGGN
jgi:hypothetical protein